MTELIWDGKYNQDGKKNAPVRIALPFQTIETVNESAQDRKRTLDIFAQGGQTEWRNRLIWGDKKYVLPSLLPEFTRKVNLSISIRRLITVRNLHFCYQLYISRRRNLCQQVIRSLLAFDHMRLHY